jgi:hypothetical protein
MYKKLLLFHLLALLLAFNACKTLDPGPEENGGTTPAANPLASANWNNTFTSDINYFPPVSGPLSGQQGGNSMRTDAAGNIYIIGALKGSMDVDPGPGVVTISQSNTNGMSLFLAKYNSAGAYQWSKVINGTLFWDSYTKDVSPVLALDNSGNIYVYSTFSGTTNFGGSNQAEAYRLDANNTKQSTYTAFLAKYSTNGDFQWGKTINDQSTVSALGRDIVSRDMRIDANGNIYIIGQYIGDIKFTNGSTSFSFGTSFTYGGSSPANNTFVAKLNNSGNVIWATNLFNSVINGFNLALDNNNDVIITGVQSGAATFTDVNGQTIFVGNKYISNTYPFVAKINNNSGGKIAWFKSFTLNEDIYLPSALAAGTDGSIYLAGKNVGKDMIYKLAGDGTITWSKVVSTQTGSNSSVAGPTSAGKFNMTLNANNDVILLGTYSGTITPNGATAVLTGTSKVNTYLVKYNTSGNYVWSKTFSGPAANDVLAGYFLNVDQNNHINVYGDFSFSVLNSTNRYLFVSQINDAN